MKFVEIFTDPETFFIRRAIIVSIISSFPIGTIGTFVTINRMTYIAGSISHSVLGGIGIVIYLNTVFGIESITPTLGGFIFSILSGLVISAFYLWGKERVDTAISAVWIIGMSLGILFAYFTPRYTDLNSYLFGNILLISRDDIVYVSAVSIGVVLAILLFFYQFMLVSFDRDFSTTRGIEPKFFLTLLILLTSLVVFLMIKIVGIILSIALITLPSAIANLFLNQISKIISTSVLIAALSQILGISLSYELNLPTSVTITLILSLIYVLSLVWGNISVILFSKKH